MHPAMTMFKFPELDMYAGEFPELDMYADDLTSSSYFMIFIFGTFVLVILMSLMIAIMGYAYNRVKASELIEEQHGHACRFRDSIPQPWTT